MNDLDTSSSIINLDARVSPAILAGIFGCNVSLIYQDVQAGKYSKPITDYTYREAIQATRKYLIKNEGVKIEKLRLANELAIAKLEETSKTKRAKAASRVDGYASEEETSMPPLMAAKYKQDIRVNIARESHLWIKASIERGEYISLPILVELAEPFIMAIRQSLLTIGMESDETEKQVDMAMTNLYSLGVKLVEDAKYDANNFIDTILTKDIVPEEIELDNEPPKLL